MLADVRRLPVEVDEGARDGGVRLAAGQEAGAQAVAKRVPKVQTVTRESRANMMGWSFLPRCKAVDVPISVAPVPKTLDH